MTDKEYIKRLRKPTAEEPLRILMSGCLAGNLCGYDGTNCGEYPEARRLLTFDNVKIVPFCPEHVAFGTPREVCDIHGGTGHDVLEGNARVLSESGEDWTSPLVKASEKMLELAINENVELAVLLDVSASCGSQVIYDGARFSDDKKYQIGAGVCAAQLMRNGIKVISQRDFASLDLLLSRIDEFHLVDESLLDHHEIAWYKEYFGVK